MLNEDYTFDILISLFKPVADKLAAEGNPPDVIAYRFAQYAKQKMNQKKAKDRKPALKLADKLGI